jgi:hypothetical protein
MNSRKLLAITLLVCTIPVVLCVSLFSTAGHPGNGQPNAAPLQSHLADGGGPVPPPPPYGASLADGGGPVPPPPPYGLFAC